MQRLIGTRSPGRLIARLFGGQWPYTRLFGIGPHWYRRTVDDPGIGPCAMPGCGRPLYRHWQAVGEWLLPPAHRRARIRRRAWTRLTEPRRPR